MTADLVSWWGAVAGTVALFLQWQQHRADRPKVFVQARMSVTTDPAGGKRLRIDISVANRGVRLCRIESVWIPLLRPNGGPVTKPIEQKAERVGDRAELVDQRLVAFHALHDWLPLELEEGHVKSFQFDSFPKANVPLLRTVGSNGVVCVRLTNGKVYKTRFQPIEG